MAVDFLHRLVIEGRPDPVRAFHRAMRKRVVRSLRRKQWTEDIPFSFERLYEIAPGARKVEREIPYDPYDVRTWPVRRLDSRHAEVRYQFHTRNLEMVALVRVLSRTFPRLVMTLVTMCLDDSDVESYRVARGSVRKWKVPETRRETHWVAARKKFRLAGDEVYDDDDATRYAEERIMAEALDHWQPPSHRARPRRRQWWNVEPVRDLAEEREIAFAEISDALAEED
jgi:hypothetical protein